MRKPPKYQLHKPSGQARVWLRGRYRYLGIYGTQESQRAYQQALDEWWLSRPQPTIEPRDGLTVTELAAKYLDYCQRRYRKGGKCTSEYGVIRSALAPLTETAGDTIAAEYTPLKLLELRNVFADRWTRKSANKQLSRIRGMFKWGVSRELIPLTVYQALLTVESLRRGQISESGQQARESERVQPVPDDVIDATIAELPTHLADMVRIQRLTAMRPGELLIMRGCDIDRTKQTWIYTPGQHKTEHMEQSRSVTIGPKAQIILTPYLTHGLSWLFVAPRTNKPYTTSGYRILIRRACDRANDKAIEEAQKSGVAVTGRIVPRFHPHQLRHSALTEIRNRFDAESAQAYAGHSSLNTTEIYTKMSIEKACAIAQQVG